MIDMYMTDNSLKHYTFFQMPFNINLWFKEKIKKWSVEF